MNIYPTLTIHQKINAKTWLGDGCGCIKTASSMLVFSSNVEILTITPCKNTRIYLRNIQIIRKNKF